MADLSTLGAATLGVWTRRQALEVVSAGVVRGAAGRSWQVVWPGVLADAGFELTAEQRCWAAVLASGGPPVPVGDPDPTTGLQRRRARAVACGRTAARFWRLPLVDDDDPATGGQDQLVDDVAVGTHLRHVRYEGRVLRRHRLRLRSDDLTRTVSGLVVTTPLRTLIDLAGLLTADATVCALDDALHRRLVQPGQLAEAVSARHRGPGAAALPDLVSLADGRAESPGETLTRLVLRPVLPALEPQVELCDETGRVVARFDLGDRGRRLAVESDGRTAHAGTAMVARDRARDLRSERLGWWTERVSWYDVRCRQEQTRRRVLERAAWLDARPLDAA